MAWACPPTNTNIQFTVSTEIQLPIDYEITTVGLQHRTITGLNSMGTSDNAFILLLRWRAHTWTCLQYTTDADAISFTLCLWLMTVFRLREATTIGGVSIGAFPGRATIKSLGSSTLTSILHQLIWKHKYWSGMSRSFQLWWPDIHGFANPRTITSTNN